MTSQLGRCWQNPHRQHKLFTLSKFYVIKTKKFSLEHNKLDVDLQHAQVAACSTKAVNNTTIFYHAHQDHLINTISTTKVHSQTCCHRNATIEKRDEYDIARTYN